MDFVVGNEYRRRDIHEEYGGQQQGGISTPAKHTIIFLFTGEQGEQYGYHDGFQKNGLFWYTGEGQVGDMEMLRGNLAVRDSNVNQEEIHLFEYTARKSGLVRYLGEMEYFNHHISQAPDVNNNLRDVFIFELALADTIDALPDEQVGEIEKVLESNLWNLPLEDLKALAKKRSSRSASKRERLVNDHNRSESVRIYAQRRANGICEGCNFSAPFKKRNGKPYLETHHIMRISDNGPDEPENVAALCPNCHRRAHYSEDAVDFSALLQTRIHSLES